MPYFKAKETVGGGGGQRKLETIPPGPDGYSIPYLRCTVCVGQAVTYVRPLQQELDLSPQSTSLFVGDKDYPTVECMSCGQKVNYGHLRVHKEKECKESTLKDCGDELSDPFFQAGPFHIDLTSAMRRLVLKDKLHLLTPKPVIDSYSVQKLFKDYADSFVDLTIPTNTIHVNCDEDMFTQARLIYKRMDKNKLKAVPNVVFEGNYISELGSDAGGPSREFFFLALTSCMQEMQSGGSMFFTGTANHLVPVHDWDLLEDGNFILVGKIIGHSMIHGGTGFVGMSQGIVKYIKTESVDVAAASITTEDVPDSDVQAQVGKIIDTPDDGLSKLWMNDSLLIDTLQQAGVQKLEAKNKEKADQQILLHQVLLKRKYEVDDIIKGLKTLSLTEFLKRHPCVSPL
ncbi:uncharacterized protein LOC111347320 [Stylophora pistillata]|uniref:uncharacterized protein LOC111347320 n=1 Tax=Stylophora pistillata TaxID=50429 RepID=UPI000C042571|nr:uncharacterized protein LOC111347320 [Stylophora pistillata]